MKAAADRALRRVRGDLSANPPYDNDVPHWPDTVIVHEGTGCWGTCRTDLFDAMKRLGWKFEGHCAEPPNGGPFEARLCHIV